jgi:ABC-2 type transport system permease protein
MNTIRSSLTNFGWLVKREYWESRRGFLWAQFWAAASILVITILGIIAGEVLKARAGGQMDVSMGLNLGQILREATTRDMDQLVKALDATMLLFGFVAGMVLFFVVFFYLLGALYDDRRDRSVLFWKSLPLSDTGTVLSKAVAGIVVAPLIATGIVLAGYVGAQVVVSLWLLLHAVNPLPLWIQGEPYGVWLRLLVMVPVNALWALPTVGWLLLWSAAVRSKPFLWAIIVPIIAGMLNFWIGLLGVPHIRPDFYWGDIAGRLLLSVVPGSWINPGAQGMRFRGMHDLAAINYPAMGHAMASPQMWIGVIVGAALIAAAIWFRRWRDEA